MTDETDPKDPAEENGAEKSAPKGDTNPPLDRRILSLPGVYKLTKFRSQLEIWFVQQLEERQLRWFYEPERICRYLVDFYLPDPKCWVEVKGRVSSRDHLLLREVAETLWQERHHRLFMVTSARAYAVGVVDFRPMTHAEFWALLTAGQSVGS